MLILKFFNKWNFKFYRVPSAVQPCRYSTGTPRIVNRIISREVGPRRVHILNPWQDYMRNAPDQSVKSWLCLEWFLTRCKVRLWNSLSNVLNQFLYFEANEILRELPNNEIYCNHGSRCADLWLHNNHQSPYTPSDSQAVLDLFNAITPHQKWHLNTEVF